MSGERITSDADNYDNVFVENLSRYLDDYNNPKKPTTKKKHFGKKRPVPVEDKKSSDENRLKDVLVKIKELCKKVTPLSDAFKASKLYKRCDEVSGMDIDRIVISYANAQALLTEISQQLSEMLKMIAAGSVTHAEAATFEACKEELNKYLFDNTLINTDGWDKQFIKTYTKICAFTASSESTEIEKNELHCMLVRIICEYGRIDDTDFVDQTVISGLIKFLSSDVGISIESNQETVKKLQQLIDFQLDNLLSPPVTREREKEDLAYKLFRLISTLEMMSPEFNLNKTSLIQKALQVAITYIPDNLGWINHFQPVDHSKFINTKQIGAGSFGIVERCEYTGDDTEIQSVCTPITYSDGTTHYWCAMKTCKPGLSDDEIDDFYAEQKTMTGLRDAWLKRQADPQADPNAKCGYVLGIGRKLSDGKQVIICQLECFIAKENDMQADDVKSFLEISLGRFARPENATSDSDVIREAYQDVTTHAQLMGSIYRGISQLHATHRTHNDLANRNALVSPAIIDVDGTAIVDASAKVSDFGMTVDLDEYLLAPHSESAIGPLRWMSQARLLKLEGTFRCPLDDLLAYRIMLLETMCADLPVNIEHITGTLFQAGTLVAQFGAKHAMEVYVKNLEALIPGPPAIKTPNQQRVALFLEAFKGYLTKDGQEADFKFEIDDEIKRKEAIRDDIIDKMDSDEKFLEKAYDKFFQDSLTSHLFNYNYSDQTDADRKQMLIEIKRLMSTSIMVSDKTNELYALCLTIKDIPINSTTEADTKKVKEVIDKLTDKSKDALDTIRQDHVDNAQSLMKIYVDLKKAALRIISKEERSSTVDFTSIRDGSLVEHLEKSYALLQRIAPDDALTIEMKTVVDRLDADKVTWQQLGDLQSAFNDARDMLIDELNQKLDSYRRLNEKGKPSQFDYARKLFLGNKIKSICDELTTKFTVPKHDIYTYVEPHNKNTYSQLDASLAAATRSNLSPIQNDFKNITNPPDVGTIPEPTKDPDAPHPAVAFVGKLKHARKEEKAAIIALTAHEKLIRRESKPKKIILFRIGGIPKPKTVNSGEIKAAIDDLTAKIDAHQNVLLELTSLQGTYDSAIIEMQSRNKKVPKYGKNPTIDDIFAAAILRGVEMPTDAKDLEALLKDAKNHSGMLKKHAEILAKLNKQKEALEGLIGDKELAKTATRSRATTKYVPLEVPPASSNLSGADTSALPSDAGSAAVALPTSADAAPALGTKTYDEMPSAQLKKQANALLKFTTPVEEFLTLVAQFNRASTDNIPLSVAEPLRMVAPNGPYTLEDFSKLVTALLSDEFKQWVARNKEHDGLLYRLNVLLYATIFYAGDMRIGDPDIQLTALISMKDQFEALSRQGEAALPDVVAEVDAAVAADLDVAATAAAADPVKLPAAAATVSEVPADQVVAAASTTDTPSTADESTLAGSAARQDPSSATPPTSTYAQMPPLSASSATRAAAIVERVEKKNLKLTKSVNLFLGIADKFNQTSADKIPDSVMAAMRNVDGTTAAFSALVDALLSEDFNKWIAINNKLNADNAAAIRIEALKADASQPPSLNLLRHKLLSELVILLRNASLYNNDIKILTSDNFTQLVRMLRQLESSSMQNDATLSDADAAAKAGAAAIASVAARDTIAIPVPPTAPISGGAASVAITPPVPPLPDSSSTASHSTTAADVGAVASSDSIVLSDALPPSSRARRDRSKRAAIVVDVNDLRVEFITEKIKQLSKERDTIQFHILAQLAAVINPSMATLNAQMIGLNKKIQKLWGMSTPEEMLAFIENEKLIPTDYQYDLELDLAESAKKSKKIEGLLSQLKEIKKPKDRLLFIKDNGLPPEAFLIELYSQLKKYSKNIQAQIGYMAYLDDKNPPFPGWARIENKSGGANSAGEHGGVYINLDNTSRDEFALFKLDTANTKTPAPKPDKVISEFLTGRLLVDFAHQFPALKQFGFLPERVADVRLVRAGINPGDPITPDKTGGETYIQSVYINPYMGDLWQYAHEQQGKTTKVARPGAAVPGTAGYKRAQTSNDFILSDKRLLMEFSIHAASRLLWFDRGIHDGNFGVTGTKEDPHIASLDFGTACLGFCLPEKWDPLSRTQTGFTGFIDPLYKHHFLEYKDKIIKSREMGIAFLSVGRLDSDIIKQQIDDAVSELRKYYDVDPLKAFCKRLGINDAEYESLNTVDHLLRLIKSEMFIAVQERQLSLIDAGKKILQENIVELPKKDHVTKLIEIEEAIRSLPGKNFDPNEVQVIITELNVFNHLEKMSSRARKLLQQTEAYLAHVITTHVAQDTPGAGAAHTMLSDWIQSDMQHGATGAHERALTRWAAVCESGRSQYGPAAMLLINDAVGTGIVSLQSTGHKKDQRWLNRERTQTVIGGLLSSSSPAASPASTAAAEAAAAAIALAAEAERARAEEAERARAEEAERTRARAEAERARAEEAEKQALLREIKEIQERILATLERMRVTMTTIQTRLKEIHVMLGEQKKASAAADPHASTHRMIDGVQNTLGKEETKRRASFSSPPRVTPVKDGDGDGDDKGEGDTRKRSSSTPGKFSAK